MVQQVSFSNTKPDKAMTTEQFNQVVEAILAGKYSWACLLILRFAGYNPLHYIPYRTYNRLLKENNQVSTSKSKTDSIKTGNQLSKAELNSPLAQRSLSSINDLSYQETLGKQQTKVCGGNMEQWLNEKMVGCSSSNLELFTHKNQEVLLSIQDLLMWQQSSR